jgi:hypothetical protein
VEPQRLATWILTRSASDYGRDSFIGDLVEQYEERGGWWYWRQVLGAVRARFSTTLATAVARQIPAAEFIGDLVMWIVLGVCGCFQLLICAVLLLIWTPLANSDLGIFLGSILVGGILIGVVAAHEIRSRRARQPYLPLRS